ncbi:MAG: hypothetical protein HY720_18100 [Planctomycetes bacterium]|nr:hypothetical protein [Planctomycetota bacterium]
MRARTEERAFRAMVIGVGAVGGTLARALVAGGARPVLVDPRTELAGAGARILHPSDLTVDWFEGVELVLVATKAGAAIEALGPVPPRLPVATLFNGFHPAVGKDRTGPMLRGAVDFAASVRDGHVVCTQSGRIYLPRIPVCQRFARFVGTGEIRPRLVDDTLPHVWGKLLFNASLDPVAALTGRTLGQVFSHRPSFRIFRRLFREGCEVARAAGVRPARIQGADPFRFARLLRTPAVSNVIAWIAGRRARDVESTMLADVLAGRTTEIDYMNGFLVREAERLGVETRTHRRVIEMVEELTAGKRVPYPKAIREI